MKEKRVFTIGRHPSCHIVLADEKVSKKHAEIVFCEGGKIKLSDKSSTNGTYLLKGAEFKKLRKPSYISPTDTVKFGPCEMAVKDLLQYLRLIPEPELDKPHKLQEKERVQGIELIRCAYCGYVKQAGQTCPNPRCNQDTVN